MSFKIGVLGGIGPEATGEFYNKLICELQKKELIKSNKDFPQIIINSIPAPELIYEKISEEELLEYVAGLKDLEKFGVDFIVMVCNTIHLYHEQLQKQITTPIIDLRDELKNFLKSKKIKSTLVIGTPNTIKQNLYNFKDITYHTPTKEEIETLTDCIFYFNKGVKKSAQTKKVKVICDKYLEEGAETVILGCTEFAVMLNQVNLPKINTIDVMVAAVIERFSSK